VPLVGEKSYSQALQRDRGAPLGRGHSQQDGQSQRGQTGAPSVSGQRTLRNACHASDSSIRITCSPR